MASRERAYKLFFESDRRVAEELAQLLEGLSAAPEPDTIERATVAAHRLRGDAKILAYRVTSELAAQVEHALEWLAEDPTRASNALRAKLSRASAELVDRLRVQHVPEDERPDSGLAAEIRAELP